MNDVALRGQLIRLLDWKDAHTNFDESVAKMPVALRHKRPKGSPHSVWELLEHIRLAQADILDFCINPGYEERKWPDDYWPDPRAVPTAAMWSRSIKAVRADCEALKALAGNESIDLFAAIPHGTGQTYLRELLLVADHNAYHVGQLVAVRRMLGAWPAK